MASAIMGLKSDGVTIIENSEVVKKSFPAFFDFLNKLI
jgi:5-enolpyruvylshikimate-3-phosphate synthase